jgi:hypothetical protein
MLTDGYLKFQVEYDDAGAPYVPSQMLASDNGKPGSAGQDKRGADDEQDTKEDDAYHKKGQGQAETPGLAKDRKVEEADQVKKESCASGVNDLHKMASSKKRKLDDGEDGREEGIEKAIEKERGKCQEEAVQRSEVKGLDTFAAGEVGMDHPDSMVDLKMVEGNKMDDLEKKKKKKRKGGGQEEEDEDKAEAEVQDTSENKKKKDKKDKRDSEDEAYEVREEKKDKKNNKREKKADSEEADEGSEESTDRRGRKEKKKKKKKGKEEEAGGDSDGEEKKKMKEKKGKRDGVEMTNEVTDANDVEEFSGESIAALEEEIRRLKEQVAGIERGVVPGEGQGLDGTSDEMATAVQRQRENKKKKKKKKKRASEYGDVPRLSASEKEALVAEALRQVALLREAE